MTLQIIDISQQPSTAIVVAVAVIIFIASTIISGFVVYKIKLRKLMAQAEKDENQPTDNDEK